MLSIRFIFQHRLQGPLREHILKFQTLSPKDWPIETSLHVGGYFNPGYYYCYYYYYYYHLYYYECFLTILPLYSM